MLVSSEDYAGNRESHDCGGSGCRADGHIVLSYVD